MAKNSKTKRVAIEELPVKEAKLTEKELEKVKGGLAGTGIGGVDVGITSKQKDIRGQV